MRQKRSFRGVMASLAWAAIAASAGFATFDAAAFSPSPVPLPNIDRALHNLVLALSVEWPTGDTSSYGKNIGGVNTTVYSSGTTYYGYFDPTKCYTYSTTNLYFSQASCAATFGTFKGNLLNWASMANIDQFRQILTGGNRLTDTTSLTVLQRAFQDINGGTGVFPDRSVTTADSGDASNQYSYKSGYMGDKMLVQLGATSVFASFLNSPSATDLTAMTTLPCGNRADASSSSTSSPNTFFGYYHSKTGSAAPSTLYCYHVRVQVCVSGALETNFSPTNCTAYGSGYKPEGLIQQFNLNMRFSTFGYVFDALKVPQGGVLRAQMKSVGPTVNDPLNGLITNPGRPEWDASTGIISANPDSADATASSTASGITIANSGVLNYLNKFGYPSATNSAGGYKSYDTVSELYYEALRYLRGLAPSSQATSSLTAAMYDGFPIVTAPSDPITSACQQNYIFTIGDVNCWCDARVPGGQVPSGASCGGSIPTETKPADWGATAFTTPNFGTSTNSVGTLEGGTLANGLTTSNLSQQYFNTAHDNSFFIAGMAYWAHINDIRPDKAANRRVGQIQNVTSYMIDVLEPLLGTINQDGTTKTQFWLAAKYGGFDTTLTASPYTDPNTFKSGSAVKSWDKNGDGVPDNWFAGNDPITMKNGLTTIFDNIGSASSTGDGAAPGTSGVSLATASEVYYASYTLLSNGGQGSVKGCAFTATLPACAATPDWDTALWLTPSPPTGYTYQTYTTRNIITRSGSSGVPFLFSSLATADQTRFNVNPATQVTDSPTALGTNRVNYIRGDSTNEIASGGVFRSRPGTKLGDIVSSGPVYVAAPGSLYFGSLFSGYSSFVSSNSNRKAVIYVGANDGMLHALDASNGKELMAYVPGYFLASASGKTSARVADLTNPAYTHQFFVDATPMVGDVMFGSTWKTVLVGAYGGGGKGFFALDITDPTKFTESNAGTLSLWELSDSDDSDIGYTFNQPTSSSISGQSLQMALIPNGSSGSQWAIIVGNGFGSSAGKAALLFINPQTGSIIQKIVVESATGTNGLATPFPVDTDQDGIIDTIWAGDLMGNLWRVRWNTSTHAWVSTKLYAGQSSPVQPITAAPAAAPHSQVAGAWGVVFGTGKYVERSDYNTSTQQSLYGVVDTFANSGLTRSNLVAQTIVTETTASTTTGDFFRETSANSVNFSTSSGWYLDLPTTNGERSISNPTIPADTGIALLGSYVPATACLTGTGYVNVVNAFSGQAVVDTNSTLAAGDYSLSSANGGVSGANYLASWGGQGMSIPYFSLVLSNAAQAVVMVGGNRSDFAGAPQSKETLNKTFVSGKRFSWRELR